MSSKHEFDVFSPKEIAIRVEDIGVIKARLPLFTMVILGILAGAFIGLGAMYYVLVVSDGSLGFALSRILGGIAFSLGLLLVVVAGAELFTGNNLIVMAWADGKLSTFEVMRNWIVVCSANFLGAVGLALLVFLTGHTDMNGGAVGKTYVAIATAKISMPFWTAFFKGILCNVLVCLAVWMTFAGRNVTDKFIAIVFPVSAFVAAGFEHSIANMFIIPLAILHQSTIAAITEIGSPLLATDLLMNLVPVIAGNLVGGSLMVALVYHFIYRK